MLDQAFYSTFVVTTALAVGYYDVEKYQSVRLGKTSRLLTTVQNVPANVTIKNVFIVLDVTTNIVVCFVYNIFHS